MLVGVADSYTYGETSPPSWGAPAAYQEICYIGDMKVRMNPQHPLILPLCSILAIIPVTGSLPIEKWSQVCVMCSFSAGAVTNYQLRVCCIFTMSVPETVPINCAAEPSCGHRSTDRRSTSAQR